jgi:coenzyme F420-reducing hydrogenase beta subunit
MKIQIGDYTLQNMSDGSIWLTKSDGEMITVKMPEFEIAMEAAIKKFFDDNY